MTLDENTKAAKVDADLSKTMVLQWIRLVGGQQLNIGDYNFSNLSNDNSFSSAAANQSNSIGSITVEVIEVLAM